MDLSNTRNRSVAASIDDFFLPNFCQGRAVFLLVLVTELFVLAMVLAASGIIGFSWDYLALVSLFVQWIVLLNALCLCALRRSLALLSLPQAVTAAYALILIITLLVSLIAQWVLAGADSGQSGFQVNINTLLRNLIVSAIMTGLVLRYFYVQNRLRQKEQAELQARIQALQSRIRPHFLFNSMNIIASLIESEPETAERVVEDLSELFRASLKQADSPVSLEHEIELCKRYIGIEKLRLGDRLRVNWQVEALPASASIPLLTLQPLLENAIYHGIQPLADGGQIGVLIQHQKGAINITVSNPCPETKVESSQKSNRIALENIRSRLQALYGEKARLSTHVSDGVFVTQLSYPLFDNELKKTNR